MNIDQPFATLATDSGLVSGILHVSPVFVRWGAPRRGTFSDRRLARARRSDARNAARHPAPVTAMAAVEVSHLHRF